MNDQCMDDNINGNRKRPFPPIRPSLKREEKFNVRTPVTPIPIQINERSGFVRPAPPVIKPDIAPIYREKVAEKLGLTEEDQTKQQERIQQYDNFQTVSWTIQQIAQGTETFIRKDYNETFDTTVGLQGYVTFGDYYNILGLECQLYNLSPNISIDGSNYVEFLLMRDGVEDPAGTVIYNPISPISPESDMSSLTGFPTFNQVGSDTFGQSFIAHLNRSNYFIGSGRADYTPRTFGVALKGIRLHFQGSQNVNNAIIGFTAYLAKDTTSKNL